MASRSSHVAFLSRKFIVEMSGGLGFERVPDLWLQCAILRLPACDTISAGFRLKYTSRREEEGDETTVRVCGCARACRVFFHAVVDARERLDHADRRRQGAGKLRESR